MKRRQFITILGGAAAWPLAARAQQSERMRRIGVLMNLAADDPEAQVRLAAFHQGLQELGWTVGRNLRIDTRWGAGDADRYRRYSTELVALAPDVILAASGATVPWLLQATRSVPIVFAQVPDPVGAGFVESLAHPGGNITGFTNFEFSIGGKLLELLKEIAPRVTRAAVLRDAADPAGVGQWGAIQTAAPSLGLELRVVDVRDAGERARHHDIRAWVEWWNDRHGERADGDSSRSDHYAGCSASTALCLRLPLPCDERWADLLWA